jgi:beta-galactosidase
VLMPVTYWARGERNIGGVLPLIILTNCDYIETQFGDRPVKRYYPDRETYPHLPHPPVILDQRNVTPEEFGTWGFVWKQGIFRGYVDGQLVKTVELPGDPLPTTLQIAPDATELRAAEKDSVRVIVRALDQCGNVLPFYEEPVSFTLEGPGRIIGPSLQSFKGGVTGFWLEAGETAGTITLKANCGLFAEQTVTFTVSG